MELASGDYRLVFNLCEALAGDVRHEHVPAAAVELLGLPMTGAGSLALGLCLRKALAGAVLQSHGIAVPDGLVVAAGQPVPRWHAFPAIVKPATDDGSYGIHADSVVRDRAGLVAALRRGHERWDQLLVQRFVGGREFTLAVVGDVVLPHAELDFRAFPRGVPPIVTYDAKWTYGSAEERGLVCRCPAPVSAGVAARLTALPGAHGPPSGAKVTGASTSVSARVARPSSRTSTRIPICRPASACRARPRPPAGATSI